MKKIILLFMFMFVSISTIELKASTGDFCDYAKVIYMETKEHKTKEEINQIKYCKKYNEEKSKEDATVGIIFIVLAIFVVILAMRT